MQLTTITTRRILNEEEDLHKNVTEEEDTDKLEPAALKPTMNSPCETHEELIVHVNGPLMPPAESPASRKPAELLITVQEK